MDENTQKASLPPTSPEPEEAPEMETPVEETENVEEVKPDTQPTSEADVEKEESGVDQGDEVPTSKEENDKKALEGKMSQLEKERNELRKKAEIYDALDAVAKKDPEFMKIANQRLVEEGYIKPSVPEPVTSGGEVPTGTAPDISSHPAVQWAMQKQFEEKQSRNKFFEEFQSDKPDLSEGTQEEIGAKMNAISATARLNINMGLDEKEAYNQAYLQILHPEKIKENAELSGMAKAQSATASVSGASGGKAKTKASPDLTAEEKAIASSLGLSEEDYAAGKDL